VHCTAGPWFTVHEVREGSPQHAAGGWKSLDKIWISNGSKADVAIVQTRVRFADDKDLYTDDAHNTQNFNFAVEAAKFERSIPMLSGQVTTDQTKN